MLGYSRLRRRTVYGPYPPLCPDLAKKQVNANDAHYIEVGSLKLGTADDYRVLENGRADRNDSGFEIGVERADSAIPADRAFLEKFGHHADGGRVQMFHCSVSQSMEPAWIFCMTEIDCWFDPKPEEAKAHFVVNVFELGRTILEMYPEKMQAYWAGQVRYRRRYFWKGEADNTQADWCIKDKFFRDEREIRLVFAPHVGVPVSTLITPADERISKFFTRTDR